MKKLDVSVHVLVEGVCSLSPTTDAKPIPYSTSNKTPWKTGEECFHREGKAKTFPPFECGYNPDLALFTQSKHIRGLLCLGVACMREYPVCKLRPGHIMTRDHGMSAKQTLCLRYIPRKTLPSKVSSSSRIRLNAHRNVSIASLRRNESTIS